MDGSLYKKMAEEAGAGIKTAMTVVVAVVVGAILAIGGLIFLPVTR